MSTHPLPMLAVAGEPFDSEEYLFEVKWDGVRALAACGPTWRLWGRDGVDYRDRYPELAVLARVPSDTVLDGELVRWGPSGVPTLGDILRRHQLVHPGRIARASRNFPVAYMVFDLLRLRGRSLLARTIAHPSGCLAAVAAQAQRTGPGVLGRNHRRQAGASSRPWWPKVTKG